MKTNLPLCLFLFAILNACEGRWLYFGSYDNDITTQKAPVTSKRVDAGTVVLSETTPVKQDSSQVSSVYTSYVPYISGYIDGSAKSVLKKVGNFVPLKGVASVAADLGIPGGDYVMSALSHTEAEQSQSSYTPVVFSQQESNREGTSVISPKFAMARSNTVLDPLTTTLPPPPSFREEVSSLVGTMYGEKECMKKLACLSGKRLSNIRGTWAITVGLTTMGGMMPESLQDPYNALKNSIMYTDDCSQYQCREEANTDL